MLLITQPNYWEEYAGAAGPFGYGWWPPQDPVLCSGVEEGVLFNLPRLRVMLMTRWFELEEFGRLIGWVMMWQMRLLLLAVGVFMGTSLVLGVVSAGSVVSGILQCVIFIIFIAICRTGVKYDGRGGSPLHPVVWSAESVPKGRLVVPAVRDRLPGPEDIWAADGVLLPVLLLLRMVAAGPFPCVCLLSLLRFWVLCAGLLGVVILGVLVVLT